MLCPTPLGVKFKHIIEYKNGCVGVRFAKQAILYCAKGLLEVLHYFSVRDEESQQSQQSNASPFSRQDKHSRGIVFRHICVMHVFLC